MYKRRKKNSIKPYIQKFSTKIYSLNKRKEKVFFLDQSLPSTSAE